MTTQNEKHILVYADWEGLNGPVLMGELGTQRIRGKEIFSFSYSDTWIERPACRMLDPELQFYRGRQYAPDHRPNFGVFLDSSPDRWGRLLMKRREALVAREENRPERVLLESDYLLGVFDTLRMGGIRFKVDAQGHFLNNEDGFSAPPMASLRELEYACRMIEQGGRGKGGNNGLKWLMVLLAPGSSIGGARPKAGVRDENNHLWIAKFPSLHDNIDVGAWEMVLHQMAVKAGIEVPQARLIQLAGRCRTFLSRRFDRSAAGRRIHIASAMTMLGYLDGTGANEGVSYLELAGFITRNCHNSINDLEQLWRRIVFNIMVSNTDDHLRNHSFILDIEGWRLSPAYDMNPNPFGTGLSLNISETDNALDLDLALDVAKYFKIKNNRAREIQSEITKAVNQWHQIANSQRIPRTESDQMRNAFQV